MCMLLVEGGPHGSAPSHPYPPVTRLLSITSRCWSSVSFRFLQKGRGLIFTSALESLGPVNNQVSTFLARHIETEAILKLIHSYKSCRYFARKIRVFETASHVCRNFRSHPVCISTHLKKRELSLGFDFSKTDDHDPTDKCQDAGPETDTHFLTYMRLMVWYKVC